MILPGCEAPVVLRLCRQLKSSCENLKISTCYPEIEEKVNNENFWVQVPLGRNAGNFGRGRIVKSRSRF